MTIFEKFGLLACVVLALGSIGFLLLAPLVAASFVTTYLICGWGPNDVATVLAVIALDVFAVVEIVLLLRWVGSRLKGAKP